MAERSQIKKEEEVDEPKPQYVQYSQYRNWRFTKEELKELRQKTLTNAINSAKKNIEEEYVWVVCTPSPYLTT